MKEMLIKKIITATHVYEAGEVYNTIKIESLHFTGDPFDHYVGRGKDGEILFTISHDYPKEVIYLSPLSI